MATTSIEWTKKVWNPTTGCTKVSQGCKRCYAERMAARLQAMGLPDYADGFELRLHPHRLEQPKRWRRPARIFVDSMSDLFHEAVPLEFIQQVFAVMAACPQHTFQVLTKRAERLAQLAPRLTWSPNIWMGVSVEDQATADARIPHLLTVPAAVRFLSCEPLLGPVDLTFIALPFPWTTTYPTHYDCLRGHEVGVYANRSGRKEATIHWVIVGGESGPGARPMHSDWARTLRDQCAAAQVPFFFKQWGEYNEIAVASKGHDCIVGAANCHPMSDQIKPVWMRRVGKKAAGRLLDGIEHNAYPLTPAQA